MKQSNTPMRFAHLATVAAAQRLVIEHASYFPAGQEVWLSASRNKSGDRSVTAVFTGYHVAP